MRKKHCIKFQEYLPNKCNVDRKVQGPVRLLSRPLPSSCCTLRACGNDRPGLTRRQSRSRLRGSYEEVGGNIFFSLSLSPLLRAAVIFPTQSPWQRFDYFRWRRRQRRRAIGRAPSTNERTPRSAPPSRSRSVAAQGRRQGGGNARVWRQPSTLCFL